LDCFWAFDAIRRALLPWRETVVDGRASITREGEAFGKK
jgi:hypothetical protein